MSAFKATFGVFLAGVTIVALLIILGGTCIYIAGGPSPDAARSKSKVENRTK